jgi:integrase
MGKDLRGKELGKNLSQEKSGLYLARFVDRYGKRQSKRFRKVQEARQWVANSVFLDEHSNPMYPQSMIVDAWFKEWIELKKTSVRMGTIETYTSYYNNSIKSEIGNMKLVDVKPMHCQKILSKMDEKGYHQGTIKHVRIILYGMFEDAKENDVIVTNPIKRSLKIEVGKPAKIKEALTIEEQTKLFEHLVGHKYENQYILALQTGLRVGELVGLRWDDIDFENRTLKVERTMKYVYATNEWRIGSPKSNSGKRVIPLTDVAIDVLKKQKEKNRNLEPFPMKYKDSVFIDENGLIKYGSYDNALSYFCRKIGIKHITMHNLRHTFATRCISAGMKPKTLQTILGHASIDVTMDLYVHTSEEDKFKELDKVSKLLNVV